MCLGGSAPKIDPPQPAPPPPPPPPPAPEPIPVQPAADTAASGPGSSSARKKAGRDALRIDLTQANPGGSTGLNIPV